MLVETLINGFKTTCLTISYREPANRQMDLVGRNNISVQSLFDVMSTPPVLNKYVSNIVKMNRYC